MSVLKINKFIWKLKKNKSPDHLLRNFFLYQILNIFSALLLLCKINVLEVFDKGDFFQIFVISRSTKILIESNFWLGIYVPYILNNQNWPPFTGCSNHIILAIKNQRLSIFSQILRKGNGKGNAERASQCAREKRPQRDWAS